MADNRRTIVVPEPEFRQWQRHAATLGGTLGRTVSVSEVIRNAVANAIREFAEDEQKARTDAGVAAGGGLADGRLRIAGPEGRAIQAVIPTSAEKGGWGSAESPVKDHGDRAAALP